MSSLRITIFLLMLALILPPAYDASASLPQKRVLVLYSEDKAHPAHELTDQGIRATFQSNKLFDVQLYPEYLNVSRFGGPSHARTMADYLRRKYSGLKLDAIITVYPPAVDFLRGEGSGVFPGTPIVANEMSRNYAEKLQHSPVLRSLTGTITGDNAAGVLDVALRIKPDSKRAALVGGTSPNDVNSIETFRRGLQPHLKKLELIDLTGLPMEATLTRVGSLPPDTIVLYAAITRDGEGRLFVPRETLLTISRASKSPVFGLYDSYMGYGIVGGRLVSFEQHGRVAAGMALRIMGGESPASIPFGGEQAYITAFDWRELKRWNIPETVLPAGAEIRYRVPSIWEEHRGTILGGLFFMIFETLLIVALFVNLHKRKQAEIEARQRLDELAHVTRVATMGELTSSLAHELNQPLTAIRNYANVAKRLLSQNDPDLGKAREALDGILRDDRRAAEVISRVRGLLKKEEPRYRPLHMNNLIQNILGFVRSDSVLEGLSIETELAAELPAVLGDRVQLQQVLLNLMLNAVDAMNKTKPNLRKLVIKTENEEDRGVKVSVRDFGLGIDEADRDKLFEPFYTTKPGGMGMGLAISQRIMHGHGGEIRAENNPGGGATFSFTLPATDKESVEKS